MYVHVGACNVHCAYPQNLWCRLHKSQIQWNIYVCTHMCHMSSGIGSVEVCWSRQWLCNHYCSYILMVLWASQVRCHGRRHLNTPHCIEHVDVACCISIYSDLGLSSWRQPSSTDVCPQWPGLLLHLASWAENWVMSSCLLEGTRWSKYFRQ